MSLGDNKAKFLFICQGWLPPAETRRVVLGLIRLVGMTPARSHPVDDYPLPDGTGGDGFSLFQPLVESYAVADVYYDRNETEILISTCKPERLGVDEVISFLGKELGPASGGRLYLRED
jgi:hypothetical protein